MQADLGCALFRRTRPALELTAAGHEVFAELRYSFGRIYALIARIQREQGSRALTINVLPTFALRFLIPRLPQFHARHPQMQIDVAVGEQPLDFATDPADVGIRYGRGDWPHTRAWRIMEEDLVVDCAPTLLNGPEVAATDLDPRLLIRHTTRIEAWPDWFESRCVIPALTPAGLGFEHFFMVIEAAVAGLGFALLPRFLIGRELAEGSLVIASPHGLRRDQAYYVLCAPERQADPRIVLFRSWLAHEAADLATPAPA